MSTVDDHLRAIYHEAERIRDQWWAHVLANLNAQAQAMGSMLRFIEQTEAMMPPMPAAAPVEPPPMPDPYDYAHIPEPQDEPDPYFDERHAARMERRQ